MANQVSFLRIAQTAGEMRKMGDMLSACIDAAVSAGDLKAGQFFSSERGRTSVYVPFGLKIALRLNVPLDAVLNVSPKGPGFAAHSSYIASFALSEKCGFASAPLFAEKCGLDLCLSHAQEHHIMFAYEAEMDKIPLLPHGIRDAASRAVSLGQDSARSFYLDHLKDLDKLAQIDSPYLFYLGCVQSSAWGSPGQKEGLQALIEKHAGQTLARSCCPGRTLGVLLTSGRKRLAQDKGLLFGLWENETFSWGQEQ